ncbi:MAG: ThiF family adenylyltransferase [Candidatus Lokiarchaeota archaeon]|nr:ThiF family adenylyltransferase [Candidatus Lokiarchaeota archaeon]
MFANQKMDTWSEPYWEHVIRNIGPVTFEEQETIRTSRVAVLGVGGLGGPLAENLVRAGCQNLVICDFDVFDESNLNRQICTTEDIGKRKIDVVESFLHKIDPEVSIRKFFKITQQNINSVLEDVKVVALTLDDPATSIFIAREARKRKIPMIESWAVPFLFTWWFTPDSVDYEMCYGLDTQRFDFFELSNIKKEINLLTYQALLPKVFRMPGVREKYDREPGAFEEMMSGNIGARSFAPFVRITADFLSVDVIFSGILNVKPKNLAPNLKGFDYMRMEVREAVLSNSKN